MANFHRCADFGVECFHKLPICSSYNHENKGQMRGHSCKNMYPTQSIGGLKIYILQRIDVILEYFVL
jgi:hypothetical protein